MNVALTSSGFRYHRPRPGTSEEFPMAVCGGRIRDSVELAVARVSRPQGRTGFYVPCGRCFS